MPSIFIKRMEAAKASAARRKTRRDNRKARETRIEARGEERAEANITPATNNEGLTNILDQDFRTEFDRLQGSQAGLEDSFLTEVNKPIDFEAFRGELSALAESVTGELFGAGGTVETLQRGARGATVQSGFGTSSGGLTNATQNIFAGARDEVASQVAQGAIQLSGQAVQNRATTLGALGSFTQFQGGRLDSLRESLFGGQASIEQLRLAEDQLKDNRLLLDESIRSGSGGGGISGAFSGAATGALVGNSLFPGVGGIVGGVVGGIAGLF